MARRGLDFNEVRTQNNDKAPSIAAQVDLYKFPPDKFVTIRIVSPVFMYSGYWVKSKKKDGSPVKFYMPSPSYNPETQSFDSTIYDPFYEIAQGEKSVEDREARLVQVSTYGYCCAIIQSEERNRPSRRARPTEHERTTGFKEKDSDSWTPVKVLRLSSTVLEQISGIVQTNIVRTRAGEERPVSIAHPKFGLLLRIKHSPKKSPASQYQVIPGDRAPLTEEQAKYLTWDLSNLESPEPEDRLRSSYQRWAEAMGLNDKEDFDEEEEPRRGKRKSRNDDEDEGDEWDEEDSDGFDDDEAPPARRGGKKPAPSKKPAGKRRPEPEDEDEDFEDGDEDGWDEDGEEEEEDDAPPTRRNKPASKPTSKKRRPEPEPEDDDEWDNDSDDEGEDDWDDDGEEEEAPPTRKKPASKSAGKRRPEPEPEEDDWDDGDDEEDGNDDGWDDEGSEEEEDAPPPKRLPAPSSKKPVASKKPAGKRRPPVEDDMDDYIPF